MIWILDTPLLGLCFILGGFPISILTNNLTSVLVLFMKQYTLNRKFVRSDEEAHGQDNEHQSGSMPEDEVNNPPAEEVQTETSALPTESSAKENQRE